MIRRFSVHQAALSDFSGVIRFRHGCPVFQRIIPMSLSHLWHLYHWVTTFDARRRRLLIED